MVTPSSFAGKTLGMSFLGERASEDPKSEHRERRVLGKLEPHRRRMKGLEEKNSKRGAALFAVNNCGAENAASRR